MTGHATLTNHLPQDGEPAVVTQTDGTKVSGLWRGLIMWEGNLIALVEDHYGGQVHRLTIPWHNVASITAGKGSALGSAGDRHWTRNSPRTMNRSSLLGMSACNVTTKTDSATPFVVTANRA